MNTDLLLKSRNHSLALPGVVLIKLSQSGVYGSSGSRSHGKKLKKI